MDLKTIFLKKEKKIPTVKEAHMIYGVYDIIARAEAEPMDKLKETISWNIRLLDKVKSTLALIVIEGK